MPAEKLPESLYRPIGEIRENENNPRTHPRRQIELIAKSIERFGFLIPVLVDEDGILIAGHGRIAAAKMLGLESVPALEARGLSKSEKAGLLIGDNRLAELSGWDPEMLLDQLGDLEHIDAADLGFSDDQLATLLESAEKELSAAPPGAGETGAPGSPRPPGQPIIQYTIIFDTELRMERLLTASTAGG